MLKDQAVRIERAIASRQRETQRRRTAQRLGLLERLTLDKGWSLPDAHLYARVLAWLAGDPMEGDSTGPHIFIDRVSMTRAEVMEAMANLEQKYKRKRPEPNGEQ